MIYVYAYITGWVITYFSSFVLYSLWDDSPKPNDYSEHAFLAFIWPFSITIFILWLLLSRLPAAIWSGTKALKGKKGI